MKVDIPESTSHWSLQSIEVCVLLAKKEISVTIWSQCRLVDTRQVTELQSIISWYNPIVLENIASADLDRISNSYHRGRTGQPTHLGQ